QTPAEGRPPEEGPGHASSPPRRWSARRKATIVVSLLKGESIDAPARETQQTAARLTEWRDAILAGAARRTVRNRTRMMRSSKRSVASAEGGLTGN
ncbi:MAG: hypothetical protein AAF368_08795, partial [Planctomycetota bacterium]